MQNSVVIEAWNPEFNCSRLVSQQIQGIISHLYCNGTDNGNTTSSSTPTPSDTPNTTGGLSSGAWAGIGVGTGIFVLGLVGLVAWAILHFRSKIRSLEERGKLTTGVSTPESKEEAMDLAYHPQGNYPPVEMDALRDPAEMPAPRVILEADAATPSAEAP